MKTSLLSAIISVISVISIAQKPNSYPIAPKDSTSNIYFNTKVYDPYQWMENPNDPRLEVWITEQKKLTRKLSNQQVRQEHLFAQISSMYYDFESHLKENIGVNKTETKSRYVFKFESNESNKTSNLLYMTRGNTNYRYLAKSKEFAQHKNDKVLFTKYQVNPKQTIASVEVSMNGSDWRSIHFYDLETGKKLADTINNVRNLNSLVWIDEGFYYIGYNKPKPGRELLDKAYGQSLYYHKVGTPQESDRKIYQNPDTTGTYSFGLSKIDSSRIVLNHIYYSRGKVFNAFSYVDISNPNSFIPRNVILFPSSDSLEFLYCALFGDTIILSSVSGTPNGKVYLANINQVNKIEELIPEFDIPLLYVNRLGANKLACVYRNDGKILALIYNLKGELLKRIEFPEGKSISGFYELNPKAKQTYFEVSSFFHPDLTFQINLNDLSYKPIEVLRVPYNPNEVETRFVKFKSKDGTEIPMYITCLKKTKLDGKNPTLIYGYGGYGIGVEPRFDPSTALLMLHGGILAVPNIRGGGEEGSTWGNLGQRLNKQNAFDDFIAAAEYLINEKYSNPDKIAIKGGSHGGLLVGAVLTQRPELFKAAIAEAGAFDMLRFGEFTVGSAITNINEFGSVDNFADYKNLLSYSPLHNIKKGVKYPNVLLITGDNDDRVPPHHSYKFLATLQENADPTSLYHLYLVPGSGHGGALTRKDFTEKLLHEYYFLFDQLGVKFY